MSSNKKARQELEKIYGKKDMFDKARIAEQIEARGGIRTYREFKEHVKFKKSKRVQMEKTLTFHHLRHRSQNGKSEVENGALVNGLAHIYMHSLPREQEEVINDMLRDYKKGIKVNIARVTTEKIAPVQVVELPEIDEEDCIEIPVEPMREEELEKYEAYKRARNERVKEKFKGSER